MARIMTSAKPFKISKVLEILLETVQNPSLASKNVHLFKMRGGSSYMRTKLKIIARGLKPTHFGLCRIPIYRNQFYIFH